MNPSTNLTDISVDRISIWSSAQKQFIDVGGSYVPVTALTEPAQVSVPNADAVETQLVYISPKAGEVRRSTAWSVTSSSNWNSAPELS